MVIAVSRPDDPRIADYRAVRERDLVGREGRFMAEGEVVLRLLLGGARHRPLSLLLSQAQAERLAALVETLPPDLPVYVAGQEVMDAVVGFPIHRGILALGQAAPAPAAGDLLAGLGAEALVVGLVGLANHDNLGGIFRNAAAFGADAVLLDATCCDPLYRKAIRVSVGASLKVPYARVPDGLAMAGLLRRHGFEVLALSPSAGERLAEVARPPRVAALFGTEGPGLPDEVLGAVRPVGIPMAGGFDSLNVATTSGIVLHHLAR